MLRWTFRTVNAKYAMGLRESFRASLLAEHIDEGDLFVAELIIGELISNVVRHAPGYIDASFEDCDGHLLLHVKDAGRGFDLDVAMPETYAEDGRGLFLIRSLGGRISVAPNAGIGSRTTVSLELSRPLRIIEERLTSLAS